ncbi:MAG: ABC transporter permease [Synergistaceae bacterium]|nr:ABC transporter permease [Synergistota bacterium]NLM72143.1 ABC transporter permease [Synergistaceae bacterium]
MHRYVFKRILMLFPVLIGVIVIIFFIMYLTPGDPASIILGPTAPEEAVEKLNHELGYYDPFIVRLTNYVVNLVSKLDFGNSYRSKKPVLDEILKRMPISLLVAFNGILFASIVGITVGVISAVKQNTIWDTGPTVIAMFFAAMPLFWLGMVLLFFFSLKLGWFPSYGVGSWKGYVLPALAIGLPYASRQMRFTRSSMLECIREDYVRTARAKGAPERIVIWKHALKNALLPVITVMGNNFGALFGGAVVTETLFSIPGIGSYMVMGITTRDLPVVTGCAITIAFIYSLVMLWVDLMYAFVDPRIKAKYSD